jgi:hypothetical protein
MQKEIDKSKIPELRLAAIEMREKEKQDKLVATRHQKMVMNTFQKQYNLRYVHIRCSDDDNFDKPSIHGGLTVCYALPEIKGNRFMDVSVAFCHEKDAYSKYEGRKLATSNWVRGDRIRLRCPKHQTYSGFLAAMFSHML